VGRRTTRSLVSPGALVKAWERLHQVADDREALDDTFEDWERGALEAVSDVGVMLSLADLRLIADGANAAYRRCRADFVARDLLIANVSAFRDVVSTSAYARGGKAAALESRYDFGSLPAPASKTGAKSSVGHHRGLG
jgi:hypothetical protein